MATEAQAIANAVNAQNSSGPRTDAGKATSAKNSLKHGLTAKTILLPGEDEAAYRQLCEHFFNEYAPTPGYETDLLQLAIDTQWRLQRCGRLEAAILDADAPDFKSLEIVSKHEARLRKQLEAQITAASETITVRLTTENSQMEEAVNVRRQHQAEGKDIDLQKIGFVLSNLRVDTEIRRRDALAPVHTTPKAPSNHRPWQEALKIVRARLEEAAAK